MYWIIQTNLWNEQGFTSVVENLDRFKIDYKIVKVIPFADEIADENNEVDSTWAPPENVPVYVCGGTTLVKIAKKKGWLPGAFMNDDFSMQNYAEKWGNHMLNHDSIFTTFGSLTKPPWDEFFIRPVFDDKSFAGNIMDWGGFKTWQKKVIKLRDTYTSLDENTPILVAPLKEIYKEYRFFIVDSKIAASSLYKLGNRVVTRNDFIDEELSYFVHQRIWEYSPDRAFVIDIADTPEGFKIIEVNCINSSGFYACNITSMIGAIEDMKFKEFPCNNEFE